MKRAGILLMISLLSATVALGQAPATGFPQFGSFQAGGFDTVNRQNLNVMFQIPVLSTPGRGVNVQFVLAYNSLIWQKVSGIWTPVVDENGFATWGWARQQPEGSARYTSQLWLHGCRANDGSWVPLVHYSNFYYEDKRGTRHPFNLDFTLAPEEYPECNYGYVGTGYATDGSGFYLDATNPTRSKVFWPKGVDVQLGGAIKDSNGNFLSQNSNGNETDWTDTLGRTALKIIRNSTSTLYEYQDSNGTWQTITMNLGLFPVQTHFACGVGEYNAAGTLPEVLLPTNIQLPDSTSYTFSYEPTPGNSNYVTGRIRTVTLPTGGTYTYTYTDNNSTDGINCNDGTVTNLTRTIYDGANTSTWTYTRALVGSNWQTTILAPVYNSVQNQSVYTFNSTGQETSRQNYAGNGGGATLLRTVQTTWNGNTPASAVTTLDNNKQSKLETDYDWYGNVTAIREYDFGSGAPGSLLRTTTYSYKSDSPYINANILDRVTQKKVYSGSSGGTLVARTDIAYDENGYINYSCPTGVLQHDDTNYGCSCQPGEKCVTRGNPTSVTVYANAAGGSGALTTQSKYDSLGNVVRVIEPSSATTILDYTDSWADSHCSVANAQAYLKTSTNALGHVISKTYNSCTGTLASVTDPNNNATSYSYNDPLLRLTQISYSDGGQTSYAYNTTIPPNTVQTSKIDATRNLVTTTRLDSLGRVWQTDLNSDPDSADYTNTTYDSLGRVSCVSNPHRWNGSYTDGNTCYQYDALNRVTQITRPDGQYATVSYTGAATSVQDEGNGTRRVQRISQVDGLGRVTSACEVTSIPLIGITPSPAACGLDFSGSTNGFLTTYAYDAMDNVTSVVQGGLNPRSYVYDGLSQLTSETNPESGTTVYSYDSNGNLASRTRPLPNQWDPATTVTAYYGYDLLHRPTSVTYSNTTAHNVYTYDEAAPWGLSPSNGKGRLTSEFAYDNSGAFVAGMVFQYDSMGRVKNNSQCTPLYCGQTAFNVAYTYDLLGNMATLLNGAGITLTYAYNTAAQPVTLTSSLSDANHPGTLVSQLQYNALGLPIWATFGDNLNGHQSVTEAWNYNNRGQLQDQGGSMAIGTSPTRYWLSVPSGAYAPNGSMLSSNDSVNGGWTYAYDDFNRIVSSNKNSGQQTFSYDHDRFGNRWHQNAPQGGPAPQYTFDANNRISGFWFDPAGNLWNDGTYMYYYDAENRLVSLNSGPSYVYDAEGRRVRKTASGQTHDYIYDLAGRAIAEVDAVGSMTRGEIYLGSRHIATYSDSTYFSHLDGLGTERVRTGVTGSVVESFTSLAFGDALSGQGVSPLHFTGQERDSETGLDHFMFRHYSSTQGRWISPDPAGLAAVDPSNPQSWNRYAYVANQPTIMVDPYGLFIIRPVEDGGGGGAWSLSSGMLHMVVCFFGNCAPDPGPIGGGGDGGDDPGPPVLRRNPVPANNGRLPNGEVPLNPYAQAVFSHPTLQTAASTMTDPRTYALWTAAASVPGVIYNWGALSAAGSDLWMNVEAANPGATLKVIDVINVATPPWNIPTTSAGWTLFGYEVYDWYRNR